MRRRRTVIAGTWLLERAGVDDALTGDLAEHASLGGSAGWYWRQVVASILRSWVDTILMHKWLAMRAIATGWTIWAVLFLLRGMLEAPTLQSAWTPAAITAIRYGNWIVIGWAIGMLHRPHQGAMVLAYTAFTIVMSLPVVSRAVSIVGHPSYGAPSGAMVAFAIVGLTVGGLLSDSTLTRQGR